MEIDNLSVPEVTEATKSNKKLQANVFYNVAPMSLPTWFRHGWNYKLDRKNMLEKLLFKIRKPLSLPSIFRAK